MEHAKRTTAFFGLADVLPPNMATLLARAGLIATADAGAVNASTEEAANSATRRARSRDMV